MPQPSRTAVIRKTAKPVNDPRSIEVCKIFTEKVSVAGLEELNSDRDFPVRLLFAVALFASAVLTITTTFKVIQDYVHEKSTLVITFHDDGQILFPNITICTTAVFNSSAARSLVVVPKHVDDKLKVLGANREKLIDDTIQFMSSSMMPRKFNQSLFRYIDETWTATGDQFENENEIFHQTIPSCELTLFNCFFDGQPFDCCSEIILGGNDGYLCYGIPIANRFEKTFSKSDARPIEFRIDARMDWQWLPKTEDAFDGFLVIVGQPYTVMSNNPIAVAPGWHATVKLAQIKKRNDATKCVSRSGLPKMTYMSYYDEEGKNCEMENYLLPMRVGFECNTPMANYFPNANLSCNFRQFYAALVGAIGDLEEISFGDTKISVSEEMLKFRHSIGKVHENCYPICERWQYEPIVGYSELRNDKGSASQLDEDTSWSRITVLIPSLYYEVHKEGEKSSIYVAVSNIGQAVSIFAGVSMITFIEVFAYGLHSCYLVRKKRKARKVKPSSTEANRKC